MRQEKITNESEVRFLALLKFYLVSKFEKSLYVRDRSFFLSTFFLTTLSSDLFFDIHYYLLTIFFFKS